MTKCVCGSGLEDTKCCAPILAGEKSAPTAEALLRSRYSAYVTGNLDYLEATCSPTALKEFDRLDAERFIEKAKWQGLDIKRTEAGCETDQTGTVECFFYCTYDGDKYVQHEIAQFVRGEKGNWLFENSEINPKEPPAKVDQIGRNDPCPCGSGKKYKKCCYR